MSVLYAESKAEATSKAGVLTVKCVLHTEDSFFLLLLTTLTCRMYMDDQSIAMKKKVKNKLIGLV